MRAWFKRLLHFHQWEQVGKYHVVDDSGAIKQLEYHQQCTVCKKMRKFKL